MSKDAREFVRLFNTDAELQERVAAAAENYEGEQTDQAVFEAVVDPIAKEAGFELTWEEFEQFGQELLASKQELDEDELDQIAAGEKRDDEEGVGGAGFTSCVKVGVGFGSTLHEDGNRTICLVIGGGKTSGIGICLGSGWGC